jgi:hypothetical protein
MSKTYRGQCGQSPCLIMYSTNVRFWGLLGLTGNFAFDGAFRHHLFLIFFWLTCFKVLQTSSRLWPSLNYDLTAPFVVEQSSIVLRTCFIFLNQCTSTALAKIFSNKANVLDLFIFHKVHPTLNFVLEQLLCMLHSGTIHHWLLFLPSAFITRPPTRSSHPFAGSNVNPSTIIANFSVCLLDSAV